MEEKKNANQPQEIKDEELDQVTGGSNDREEMRRYDVDAIRCPHCNARFTNEKDRVKHVHEKHSDQVE